MNQSQKLFNHAQLLIPGGVNSPVRAFRSVGGTPPFIRRGRGAHIWDASTVATLDAITTKYAAKGSTVSIINLNDDSARRHALLSGNLGAGH